jgi:two-component sensor histidine kinase
MSGWTAIGVVFAIPALSAGGDWRVLLLASIAQWWSWGLVAAAIVAADRRLPFSERQIGRRLVAHLPLSAILTVVYVYVSATMRALMGPGPISAVFDLRILTNALGGMILWAWLVYWLILGAWLAKQYYERYLSSELKRERMERLSTEARLHSLRLQLDPHFLFNALNTISSQVEAEPKLARRMIEHLGDLLRLMLESNARQQVPLSDELEFLEHYLAIQRIRFGGRLRFEQSIGDEVHGALVPSMTIQPLVENAIRHGISSRCSGGTVRVSAHRVGDDLQLLVEDDGTGLPAGWTSRPQGRLGLSVTRQRLDGLYPDGRALFEVRQRVEGGVQVELRIPLEFEREHEAARA